jgi:putative pyruvate formate lyase activating enzyme
MESLRLLDGVVDIYMPDFKFFTADASLRYLKAKDYGEVARQVIKEMNRQVGPLKVDERGIARRGVLVRHLVMPGLPDETRQIVNFLANEVAPDTYVNVMAQYHPAWKVSSEKYAEINQPLSTAEYNEAVLFAEAAGLRLDERRRFGRRL